jgi:probable phosphoglycerate mutase
VNTIYLLRHGQTSPDPQKCYLGKRDIPLSKLGRRQILAAATFLADKNISKIFSSPLQRCLESSTIIGDTLGLVVEEDKDLIEIDLGKWDGIPIAEIKRRFPAEHSARGRDFSGYRPPGGENFSDVLQRVWPVFTRISSVSGEAAAIVAHAGVNRVILCKVLDLPLNDLFLLDQDHGCINIIDWHEGATICRSINLCPAALPA